MSEARNYLIQEINKNEMMSKKHEKGCATLNYIKHLLILASLVTGFVSISVFAYLVGIPVGIASFAAGLKISAKTAGSKKYLSRIKKKRKRHDKILSFAKTKSNTIKVLIRL